MSMLRWFIHNLRTLLLAFALAIAVWVMAVTSADPDETRTFPTAVPIEFIGQDAGLVTMGNIPQSVELTLRAPRSVWDKLTSQENAVRAVADLSGLGAGKHTITIQVQIEVRPVRVISVTPESFNLVLEPLVTKNMPVELSLVGDPATGYQAGTLVMDPAQVTISGPESILTQVKHVSAMLDLTGARQNIVASLPVTITDADGKLVTGISIHPETVEVSLPVVLLGGYRDLAVKVVTFGRPASGYTLTNVSSSPAVVTVFSKDTTLINALPGYLETTALDLSDANSNIETRLALILPTGVTLVGDSTVLVQIGISPIQGSLTLTNRQIITVNVGTGYQARIAPEYVDVILTGPLPTLNSSVISNLRVVLDLKGLGPGTYHLTPVVELTVEGVVVESILPGTVEVVIALSVTPTP
jgi:YbbR domain-containing protein